MILPMIIVSRQSDLNEPVSIYLHALIRDKAPKNPQLIGTLPDVFWARMKKIIGQQYVELWSQLGPHDTDFLLDKVCKITKIGSLSDSAKKKIRGFVVETAQVVSFQNYLMLLKMVDHLRIMHLIY